MLMKLSWYELKVDVYKFRILNVILMVTTKKILKIHTHKGTEKRIIIVYSQKHEGSKERHEEPKKHQTYRKQITKWQKSFFISN